MTEYRRQMTEYRRQKTDDRVQKTDDRVQKTDDRKNYSYLLSVNGYWIQDIGGGLENK